MKSEEKKKTLAGPWSGGKDHCAFITTMQFLCIVVTGLQETEAVWMSVVGRVFGGNA